MKVQSFYDQIRHEFMDSSQEYCCYCSEERSGISCCGENHWVEFKDLDKDSQDLIINYEFDKAYKDLQ